MASSKAYEKMLKPGSFAPRPGAVGANGAKPPPQADGGFRTMPPKTTPSTPPQADGGFRRLPPVSPTKGGVTAGGVVKGIRKITPGEKASGGGEFLRRPVQPMPAGKARPNAQAVAHANARASFKRAQGVKAKPKAKPKAAYKTTTEVRRMSSKIVEHPRPMPKRQTAGEARQAATTRQHKATAAKKKAMPKGGKLAAFLAKKMDR